MILRGVIVERKYIDFFVIKIKIIFFVNLLRYWRVEGEIFYNSNGDLDRKKMNSFIVNFRINLG